MDHGARGLAVGHHERLGQRAQRGMLRGHHERVGRACQPPQHTGQPSHQPEHRGTRRA